MKFFGAPPNSLPQLDDSQLGTLRPQSGNYIHFQPNAGAQRNILPLALYKKAKQDSQLENIQRLQTPRVAYGGINLPVVGQVQLHVFRNNFSCLLDSKLADQDGVRPLQDCKACVGVKIIMYLDNDSMDKLDTGSASVAVLQCTTSKANH